MIDKDLNLADKFAFKRVKHLIEHRLLWTNPDAEAITMMCLKLMHDISKTTLIGVAEIASHHVKYQYGASTCLLHESEKDKIMDDNRGLQQAVMVVKLLDAPKMEHHQLKSSLA